MSAAIQNRLPRPPFLSSVDLWPGYNLNSTNTRLLGRSKLGCISDTTATQYTQYGDDRIYNGVKKGTYRRNRTATPFIPISRSFHTPLDTGNEDENESVNKQNGLYFFHKKQLKFGQQESPVNVRFKENTHETENYNQQEYDHDIMPVTDADTKDDAALKAFYSTSTQRLYEGVDWSNRVLHSPAPPKTTKEPRPDMISFRYESKRYNPHSEKWQKLGCRPFSWDYIQTRDGHHISGPISFCSPSKKVIHLPGYMGHVSGGPGEVDNPVGRFVSANKLQTSQPKDWETARKGNIPGYTGQVLYSEHQPASTNDPNHLRSTTSRSYRRHNEIQCNGMSPFKKTSSMSRMVTLTHPFNPFNKVH